MTSPSPVERTCIGGPLDGQQITVACPDGFLAVDKQAGLAWRYKPGAGGVWLLDCSHDNSLIYPHGPETGERRLNLDRAIDGAVNQTLPIVAVPGDPDGG